MYKPHYCKDQLYFKSVIIVAIACFDFALEEIGLSKLGHILNNPESLNSQQAADLTTLFCTRTLAELWFHSFRLFLQTLVNICIMWNSCKNNIRTPPRLCVFDNSVGKFENNCFTVFSSYSDFSDTHFCLLNC